jgi:hypothetical protein
MDEIEDFLENHTDIGKNVSRLKERSDYAIALHNHDLLFHYTNADSLSKIVEGRAFWLSDIRYLNDASEYVHLFEYAITYPDWKYEYELFTPASDLGDQLYERVFYSGHEIEYERGMDLISGTLNPDNMTEVEKIVWQDIQPLFNRHRELMQEQRYYLDLPAIIRSGLDDVFSLGPACYVLSLSEKRDLLSQWRGYCARGGYSLGLSAQELARTLSSSQEVHEPSAFVMGKCIYDEQTKRRILDMVCDAFADEYIAMLERGLIIQGGTHGFRDPNLPGGEGEELRGQFHDWRERFLRSLLRFAPFTKHEGFSEEAEWRIVNRSAVFPGSASEPSPSFRPSATRLVPFVVMHFNDYDFIDSRHLRVTVGPMNEQVIAANSMRAFLSQKLGDVSWGDRVTISSVPYRTN